MNWWDWAIVALTVVALLWKHRARLRRMPWLRKRNGVYTPVERGTRPHRPYRPR